MKNDIFETPKMKRDKALYRDWKRCTELDGHSKTQVVKELMDKYGVFSASTIYSIVKRMEQKEEVQS